MGIDKELDKLQVAKFKKIFPKLGKEKIDPKKIDSSMMEEVPNSENEFTNPPLKFEFPTEAEETFKRLEELDKQLGDDEYVYLPSVPPQNGEFVVATKTGHPVQIQNFKDGKLHGVCKIYEGKVLIDKSHYENGKLHGEKRIYNEDGQLLMVEDYRNGLRHGLSRQVNTEGVITMRSQYSKGIQEGLTTHYTESGELQAKIHYKENKKNGIALFFYPDKAPDEDPKVAKSITYKDDKQHGDAITYYRSGKMLMKENFINNKLDGGVVEYYENGNIRKITEYKNGKPSESPVMYDINGKKIVTN